RRGGLGDPPLERSREARRGVLRDVKVDRHADLRLRIVGLLPRLGDGGGVVDRVARTASEVTHVNRPAARGGAARAAELRRSERDPDDVVGHVHAVVHGGYIEQDIAEDERCRAGGEVAGAEVLVTPRHRRRVVKLTLWQALEVARIWEVGRGRRDRSRSAAGHVAWAAV